MIVRLPVDREITPVHDAPSKPEAATLCSPSLISFDFFFLAPTMADCAGKEGEKV